MNNIFKILSVFAICIGIAACSSSSTDEPEALRDYATQYATDIAAIDTYINTHYLTRDADYNVSFDTLLPSSGHSSIRTDNAFQLKDTTVTEDGINYKIYFIKFREGTEKRPTQVDSIYVSYKGIQLSGDQFDNAQKPHVGLLPADPKHTTVHDPPQPKYCSCGSCSQSLDAHSAKQVHELV
jgi:hypothetical protein